MLDSNDTDWGIVDVNTRAELEILSMKKIKFVALLEYLIDSNFDAVTSELYEFIDNTFEFPYEKPNGVIEKEANCQASDEAFDVLVDEWFDFVHKVLDASKNIDIM